MATNTQIKNNIDLHITNKTVPGSIDNEEVGIDIKSIVDYVDQEITTLSEEILSLQPTYLKYTALISQTGTSNPVATVFENTLSGPIVWIRDSEGVYTGTLNGAFVNFKTWSVISSISFGSLYEIFSLNENTIRIRTATVSPLALADGQLNETSIEIRIYN